MILIRRKNSPYYEMQKFTSYNEVAHYCMANGIKESNIVTQEINHDSSKMFDVTDMICTDNEDLNDNYFLEMSNLYDTLEVANDMQKHTEDRIFILHTVIPDNIDDISDNEVGKAITKGLNVNYVNDFIENSGDSRNPDKVNIIFQVQDNLNNVTKLINRIIPDFDKNSLVDIKTNIKLLADSERVHNIKIVNIFSETKY